jgi:hypothetical protein
MKTGFSLVLLAAFAIPAMARAEVTDPSLACEHAAAVAEQAHGLPPGILAAIGRVESGRRDPLSGEMRPWPWTLDAEGAGAAFPTREAAVAAVTALQKSGMRSIDIGCFQVNLQQHPQAFATLADGFDPDLNADYAARFLASLAQRTGNWADAVMAYHSATPALGAPYRDRVLASWAIPGSSNTVPIAPALIMPPASTIPGLHVWTPVAPGSAPAVITLARSTGRLPVVHQVAPP